MKKPYNGTRIKMTIRGEIFGTGTDMGDIYKKHYISNYLIYY